MKHLFLATLLLLGLSMQAQSTYNVDGKHTSLVFSLGYNYTDFYGSFGGLAGKVVFGDDKDFTSAEVEFSVDVNSINTNFDVRNGHLQGERYFNTQKDSVAMFKSKHIKSLGDNTYEMTGDLTISGKTLSQTVKVVLTGQGETGEGDDKKSIMGAKGTFSFNRSNFGILGGIPTIADKVDINVSLHLVK